MTSFRFIFVNFNAWEYAGSDTLWAGIITTLSNAIEAEFGSVTTRLFRMLKVRVMAREEQEAAQQQESAQQDVVFVQFFQPSRSMIIEVVRQYGVVRMCVPRSQWKKAHTQDNTWYVVQYSNAREAHRAFESLRLSGVEATFIDPCATNSKNQKFAPPRSGTSLRHDMTSNNTSSSRNLRNDVVRNNHGDQYETTSLMRSPSTPPSQHSSSSSSSCETQDVDSGNSHSCMRQFMKHPKTVCNVPTLFWHILAVFALISLPVITYILADMLQLDIYRVSCKFKSSLYSRRYYAEMCNDGRSISAV